MKQKMFVVFAIIFAMVFMVSCGEVRTKALEAEVKLANSQFPMSAGYGLVVTSASLDGDYVVYRLDVDEDLISIDLLNESISANKANIISALQIDSDTQKFIELLKECNKGVAYHYIGTTSGNKCIIEIEPSEF